MARARASQAHSDAIEMLRLCQHKNPDKEAVHGTADRALCDLLTALGYADVVAEWEKVEKWYA